ncbi:MAG: 50S ribosomal protein L28 [Candidatus Vidania fulgoroideorum]
MIQYFHFLFSLYFKMSRICKITLKKTLFGNRVSNSNRRTSRVFLVNIQKKNLFFGKLFLSLRLSNSAFRLIKCLKRKLNQKLKF